MAKRPGVSATSRIIAAKDQHCLLYRTSVKNATHIFYTLFCSTLFLLYIVLHFFSSCSYRLEILCYRTTSLFNLPFACCIHNEQTELFFYLKKLIHVFLRSYTYLFSSFMIISYKVKKADGKSICFFVSHKR